MQVLALMGLRARNEIIQRNMSIMRENLALLTQFFQSPQHAKKFKFHPPQGSTIVFPELITGECSGVPEGKYTKPASWMHSSFAHDWCKLWFCLSDSDSFGARSGNACAVVLNLCRGLVFRVGEREGHSSPPKLCLRLQGTWWFDYMALGKQLQWVFACMHHNYLCMKMDSEHQECWLVDCWGFTHWFADEFACTAWGWPTTFPYWLWAQEHATDIGFAACTSLSSIMKISIVLETYLLLITHMRSVSKHSIIDAVARTHSGFLKA